MKSFKFNQTSNENFDQILKYRERKVAKQQIIFFALLVVIGVILGVYLYKKLVYTVFDGYVTSDVRQYRAPEYIFLKNLYV
jgi:ABC-type Mn2+/Zn2+ transport system permease subunit